MARLLWFTVHANYFSHTKITDETAAYACGFFFITPQMITVKQSLNTQALVLNFNL